MNGGHARVELLLTSGWCPFADPRARRVEDAIGAQPGRRHLRGRGRLGRGVDDRPALRRSRPQAAVPARSRSPSATGTPISPRTVRRPRRPADDRRRVRLRRGRAPVQLHRRRTPTAGPGEMFANHLYAFHAGADPGHRAEALGGGVPQGLDAGRHPARWSTTQSDTDMLVAMPLPLTDLFRDGLSPWEDCAELASRDPDAHRLLGFGQPARGPPRRSTSWSARSASSAPRRSSSTTSATTTARRSRGGWTTRASRSRCSRRPRSWAST